MMARHASVAAEQREHWEGDHSRRRRWDHPSVRALFDPRAEYVAELLGHSRAATVLDVGCGNGFLTMRGDVATEAGEPVVTVWTKFVIRGEEA